VKDSREIFFKEENIRKLFRVVQKGFLWEYLAIRYSYSGYYNRIIAFHFRDSKWMAEDLSIYHLVKWGDLLENANGKVQSIIFKDAEKAVAKFIGILKHNKVEGIELFSLKENLSFIQKLYYD
jgi:hypothetical protein